MMIKISAYDLLFFRSGKPFEKSSDVNAEVIFPPLPSTVYGALRTAYISQNGSIQDFDNGKMKDKIGLPDNTEKGSFKLKGIFLEQNNKVLLPAPLDLVVDKDFSNNRDECKGYKLKLINNKYNTDLNIADLLVAEEIENVDGVSNKYISKEDFYAYLQGSEREFILYEDIIMKERKIGIQIDKIKGTAKDKHIYSQELIDPTSSKGRKTSILAETDGADFNSKFNFKLGGENRVSFAETVDMKLEFSVDQGCVKKISDEKRFKLYLATPAIFNKKQELINSGNEFSLMNAKVKLLTAACSSPQIYTGWDIKKGKPKKLMRMVPAGTVYYFEIIDGNAEDLIKSLNGKCISDYAGEEGFGLAYIGVI